MALCGTVSTGVNFPCKGPGGNSNLYVATYTDSAVWTTTGQTITAATGTNTFYEVKVPANIIGLVDDYIQNRENLTDGWDNSVTFKLYDVSASTLDWLVTLTKTEITLIVKSRSDRYLALGVNVGGFVETSSGGIEAARDGMNGFEVTIKFEDETPPYEMSSAVFASDITVG